MDSSDGQYGWAPDDPRWTDAQAGGRGRLEPPPPPVPNFMDADTVVGGMPPVPQHPAPHDAVTESLPAWSPTQPPPVPFAPPTQFPGGGGHGLNGATLPAPTGDALPAVRPPSSALVPAPARGRPEREMRFRARRRSGDDEFRAAGRAELFSDDARYSVLFALTVIWYVPVAVLEFVWVVVIGAGDGPAGPRLFSGLAWLAAAAVISVTVVGLLRWARVGWRALTLSVAAAFIGGGVATIAHTLSG